MSASFRPSVLRQDALSGRRALITGAGSGIGRAIALRLAALGAEVTGVGRREAALAETAALAEAMPGRFVFHSCDVRDRETISLLIPSLIGNEGLDLLVNNAGGQFYAPANKISPRGWDAVIDLNLTAIFHMTRTCLPLLEARRGSVASISLTGLDRGVMGASHALAARAGVLAMTRTLALEWADRGIRLNCVGPGIVFTENLNSVARAKIESDWTSVPLGRATDAAEVAELIAFLCSDAGWMMTGQMIQIDGGASIGPGIHAWSPEAA